LKLIEPRNNTFETLMVDLTHRCNMKCANCYLPNREIPDMDIDKLEACLADLPARSTIRLAGAEPTVRNDLPEIISRVKGLGHRVVLLTNGLRLANEAYLSELFGAGLRHVYISLNGADNDDWYQRIDNLRCAERKIKALENIVSKRMILNTGTILVRGVNEGAVGKILKLVQKFEPRHALLRFKNVGALGRYDSNAESQNFSMPELETLAANAVGCEPQQISRYDEIKDQKEENTRLFPTDLVSRPGKGIWIKLTNWQADDGGFVDYGSLRRGRITPEFKIAPFFEHVRENEGGY
jgi:molybdenum cofactor biosynthesis enzyme MoaA